MKELLVDAMPIRLQLVEDASGSKKIIAKGEFGRGGVPTANRRIYSTKLFKREINKLSESMQGRKVYGELDHPDDGKTKLARVSHLVTNLTVDKDGVVIGEAELLDTTNGKELKAILEAGGSVGISSRGYGSVKMSEDGQYNVVQDDFNLMTFDFVADPAQGTAYPKFTTAEQLDKGGDVLTNENEIQSADAVKVEETAQVIEVQTEAQTSTPIEAVSESTEATTAPKEALVENTTVEQTIDEVVADQMAALDDERQKMRDEILGELMADPTVGGAKTTIESLKTLLKPFLVENEIKEEVAKVQKELSLANENVSGLTKQIESLQAENGSLMEMCRELGFNLYMERSLSKHPKYKEILESLDYKKIESLTDLKKLVAPYEEDMKAIQVKENEKISESVVALQQELNTLKEEKKSFAAKLEEANTERDFAVKLGMESASRAYMERMIVGNKNASLIREKFEALTEKTKTHVDALVEACSVSVAGARESLNESVRRRFRGSAGVIAEGSGSDASKVSDAASSKMVEESLANTLVIKEDKSGSGEIPGLGVNLKDFEKLSGLRP